MLCVAKDMVASVIMNYVAEVTGSGVGGKMGWEWLAHMEGDGKGGGMS